MNDKLYWLLERRDAHGYWHGVFSTRCYPIYEFEIHSDVEGYIRQAFDNHCFEAFAPHCRDLPQDASTNLRFEHESAGDAFGWHHADGAMILGNAERFMSFRGLGRAVHGLFHRGNASRLLPPPIDGDYPIGIAALSGHEKMQRKSIEQSLTCWRWDHSSGRLSFYFRPKA